MKNLEVASLLSHIADYLEIKEEEFKPRAYRNAANTIENLSEDIDEIYKLGGIKGLEQLPTIGKHISEKIAEFLDTGKLKYYEKLKKEVKVDVEGLKSIYGLGPKKIKALYKNLGIKTLTDLEKALSKKKIHELVGFGEKTEKQLSEGLVVVKNRPKRFYYADLVPIVNDILTRMKKCDAVKRIEVAGSFRRKKETCGDLDFVISSSHPKKVMGAFLKLPDIKKVIAKGLTKSSIILSGDVQVDLRVVNENAFGAALHHFTGSKYHNIEMRKLALKKGYTINEYGIVKNKDKKIDKNKRPPIRTETEFFKKLGLSYIDPELRENVEELALAKAGLLPKLVENKDVKGLLHNHSKWSDGKNTVLEMVEKAEQMGMEYISITDHYGPIVIANSLNEERFKDYLKAVNAVKKKVKIKILVGVEIDILKDGTLPLSAGELKKLDFVIASLHLGKNMSKEDMTKRVCDVLENYPVHALGHPTARLLNRREPIKIDLAKVFKVAKENNVFLEINCRAKRMDLDGEKIRIAKKIGCKFILGTDAHNIDQLEGFNFGVNMARRGWLLKKDVLNCYSYEEVIRILKK